MNKFEEIIGIDNIYSRLSYFRKYINIEEKPEWAKFWVVDAKGRAMWCESLPLVDTYYERWMVGGKSSIDKHIRSIDDLFSKYSWKDSFTVLEHLSLKDIQVQKLDLKNMVSKVEGIKKSIEYKLREIERLKLEKIKYENKIKELNDFLKNIEG